MTPQVEVPAIDASEVARRFGRRWAVAGVSLRVAAGTRLMVTGRNGSGKSTLLRVLSTASRLDQGHARIAGFDLATERAAVRRNVALLGHHSYLYEALTARENLEIARRFLGAPADRVDALLAEVGLDTRADDPVLAFSAGMRKRLSLARALLQDARVLLLDEPYGELDPAGFALLDRVLDDQRRRGVTVLLATHLLDHGRALCDEAIALEEGRLIWSGPASLLPEPAA
jgi:heme exporter protein A